ncbi:MAG: hypothetical protein ACI4KR_13685, partial [Ruminiclostridium sp.]
ILQKSVNNFSTEISSFSYILDKANLIVKHEGDETENIDQAVEAGKELYDSASLTYDKFLSGSGDLGNLVEALYTDPEGASSDLKSLGTSFKTFIEKVKEAVKGENIKEESTNVVRYFIETGVKSAINGALSEYCDAKTRDGAYLPKSFEDFCKAYHIADNKIEFKVNFMPDDKNNTVFVSVKCDINMPFSFPGFEKKTIVKTSYCPLWVK